MEKWVVKKKPLFGSGRLYEGPEEPPAMWWQWSRSEIVLSCIYVFEGLAVFGKLP